MKTTLFFIILSFSLTRSFAQIDPSTPWTWMKGDNVVDQPGVYGTQGIAATLNKPGSRNSSVTWRDAAGDLWLFGGIGYADATTGYLNDLWKYEPLNNKWAWVKGDTLIQQISVYGTKGIADPNNKPGGIYSGVSWTDASNNLWLFGGFGIAHNEPGFLNTLWKYDPSLNQWTWVKGDSTVDQTGVYGTKGNAHNNNKPGARYGSRTWTDAAGNLWLFGGYGYDENDPGILNDLWKYNIATNKWTWMEGDKIINQPGVYGTKGVANAANKPGARYVSTSWMDENGDLWLFGGYGYDENNEGVLNDLWKYNISSGNWTWLNGDNLIDQHAVYGNLGVAAATNKPGARYISSSWVDAAGELWLFGGYGYDAVNQGYLNDLWKYSASVNQWIWVKGDDEVDQTGIYGIQGLASSSNKSGARTGSVSWADGIGNLWLFGGYGYDGATSGTLNDLWKINGAPLPLPVKLLSFTGVLKNDIVTLQWQTETETDFNYFSVQRSFDGINFTESGVVYGKGGTGRNDYTFTDHSLKNRLEQVVYYRLKLVDQDGRFNYSKILRFDRKPNSPVLSLFPNPATQTISLSFDQGNASKTLINITDMKGSIVKTQTVALAAGRNSLTVEVSTLSAGLYVITIVSDTGVIQQKFIKQ